MKRLIALTLPIAFIVIPERRLLSLALTVFALVTDAHFVPTLLPWFSSAVMSWIGHFLVCTGRVVAAFQGVLHLISKGPIVLNDACLNGKRMKPPAKGRRARSKQHQQSRGCTSPGEFASALHHRSFAQKRRAGW